MASSKIKGITIEINGNTTKLQDALKGVDKQVYSLNGDLKALNQALKLDPKNTELLAQKQEVLARNIQASKDRLDTLKEAQRQMGDYAKLTDEQKESYNQLSVEIAKSETAIKSMNEELKKSSSADLSVLKDGLKKVGEVAIDVSKQILKVSAAIGGTLVAAITASVKSYADLEKAQKGSERLFGESFNLVEQNAKEAYKTMGLSATEYYDQVNTYVVGLKNSLKGDTKKAAQLANDVLKAQADIVSATGVNQDQVQSAFAAVMRGNYTMLDNLRLGIKGSKQGMEEVIKKVNAWNKANGKATKYQMGNYADMQQALVDYTKMVGVAGTAQKQMSTTISGSFTQMKSAFTNFLSGVGDAKALSNTINTFLKNILGAIKKLAPDLVKGLIELLKDVLPKVMNIAIQLLPIIVDGITQLLNGVITFIKNDSKEIISMATTILFSLTQAIIDNLPLLLDASIKIIVALAEGIAESLPELVPTIVDCILTIVNTILENVDLIIDVGFKILIGLIKGIVNAIPKLVKKAPEILSKLAEALINGLSKIYEVGSELVKELWEGIKSVMSWLWEKLTNFGQWVLDGIKEGLGLKTGDSKMIQAIGKKTGTEYVEGLGFVKKDIETAGENIIKGVTTGIKNKNVQNASFSAISSFAGGLLSKLKSSLKEKSPSKATEEMGAFLDLGLQEGIENNAKSVIKSATNFGNDVVNGITQAVTDTNLAMNNLSNGVEASVNPTINPTANSNPLYITIDKFYNNRQTDIQQLAEELEFYRKNSALAKGGV